MYLDAIVDHHFGEPVWFPVVHLKADPSAIRAGGQLTLTRAALLLHLLRLVGLYEVAASSAHTLHVSCPLEQSCVCPAYDQLIAHLIRLSAFATRV